MFSSLFRRVLVGITVGVFAALLIIPQTQWLAAFPLEILRGLPEINHTYHTHQVEAIAAQHPHDFDLQYAAAEQTGHGTKLQALESIENRFPNNPVLIANLLKLYCGKEIVLSARKDQRHPAEHNNPIQVAAFIRNAKLGEQLEPNNAYFPFMLAIGYTAERQTANAQSALLVAGTKAEWNEHAFHFVRGMVRLNRLIYGFSEATADGAIYASRLSPQYIVYDDLARRTVQQAIQYERFGKPQQGIALRQALIHCGGLMRAESPSFTGSIIGISMAANAMNRPGGAPAIKQPRHMTHKLMLARERAKTAAYTQYLRRHNDSSEANMALAEGRADVQSLAILDALSKNGGAFKWMNSLGKWFYAIGIIICNLLWLLVFGLYAQLRIRLSTKPSPKAWKVAVPTILAFVFLMFCIMGMTMFLYSMAESFAMVSMIAFPSGSTLMPLLAQAIAPVILLLIGLSQVRHAPLRNTIARAFAPAICVVLLVYSGALVGMGQQEQAANQALRQSSRGEGKYLAQQSGQQWPGVVRQPSPISMDMSDIASLRP